MTTQQKGYLVRFSDEERAYLRRAAYEDDRSVAGWIRRAALSALEARLKPMGPKQAAAWKRTALHPRPADEQ